MNRLSSDTARLISSLQVITRVENVVKELVENALDAGASCVEIKFEDYGLTKIEVRDNGSGINQSDIEFAAQRHYTSKISCKEDLENLQSYGFRGEALSSLCDVADVFITTRTKEDAFSTKYSFNHKGIVVATKPCHLVQGTTVVANNLFAKMPVRCQFYQTPAKKRQILKNSEDVLMAFALIHPEKRFSFIHNKSVVWQKPGCKDFRSTLENVFGSDVASHMVRVYHRNEGLQVDLCAFIPTSAGTRYHRKTNDRCFIYVNKRPVQDKEIARTIKQRTSAGSNPSGNSLKWPVAFLSMELASDKVDSNVEPDKSRVMIGGKEALLRAIDQMLSDAYSSLPEVDLETEKENVRGDCGNLASDRSQATIDVLEPPVQEIRKPQTSIDAPWSSATQWSKGQAVVDAGGNSVQPVRILTGHQQGLAPKMAQISAETCGQRPSLQRDSSLNRPNGSNVCRRSSAHCEPKSIMQGARLQQARLNGAGALNRTPSPMRMPNRSPGSNSTTKKRKASSPLSEDIRNAFLIRSSASESNDQELPKPPLLVEDENCADETETAYAEGQEIHLNFDFERIRENLSYKEDYAFAEKDSCIPVGILNGIKGGAVFDNTKRKLYLVNLLRLQETKLFWSLLENHSLRTKELPRPIVIPISTLSTEERSGLDKMERSEQSVAHPDVELTDDRICKNGFKVKVVNDICGEGSLHVCEMANSVSYYGMEDLKWILQKTGSSDRASITDARSFKAIQFLQAEAVRMSYSTPAHFAVLESLDDLMRHLSSNLENWKCFHDKPILYSVLNFE